MRKRTKGQKKWYNQDSEMINFSKDLIRICKYDDPFRSLSLVAYSKWEFSLIHIHVGPLLDTI